MSYLLDTCILSKLRKIKTHPNQKLQTWIGKHSESAYFINVLSLGEIQKDITKLSDHNAVMKAILEEWLDNELIPRFKGRVLPVYAETIKLFQS
jgi:toxin FitB